MLIDIQDLCKKYKINPIGVIHGGAHAAEELEVYKLIGTKNRIWIEANTKLCSELKAKFKATNTNDLVFDCLLWSESDIQLTFNITNNGQSSSILELGTHKINHPSVYYIETEEKKTKTLDDLFEQNNLDINLYDFLNLDLQGVELDVLKGFKNNINKMKYIYTEVNTEDVYKNCSKLNDIDVYLQGYGFDRCETKMTGAKWGDAFYMRKPR